MHLRALRHRRSSQLAIVLATLGLGLLTGAGTARALTASSAAQPSGSIIPAPSPSPTVVRELTDLRTATSPAWNWSCPGFVDT